MNREIKFRAWDKIDKKMYYNVGVSVNGTQVYENEFIPENIILDRGQEVLIPLQFTGLKDKNSKEIYEGDILNQKLEKTTEDHWTVCGSLGFYPENAKIVEWDRDGWYLGSWRLSGELRYLEVIGNIYENPELLKNK
jgi:uncharacterized phage protein (TIGR01671 family)